MEFVHKYFGKEDYGDVYGCNIVNDDTNYVGYCKYYKPNEHESSVYIEYIHIHEEHRRNGYATLMVKELQSKYHGELKWDYSFTKEGRRWYESLLKKRIILSV